MKLMHRILGYLASAAFAVAIASAGTASTAWIHQPVEPEEIRKYKR